MNVILLYTNQQHVLITYTVIFRVISARIRIYLYLQCVWITPQLKSYSFGRNLVIWYNSDEYKTSGFKNCCLECSCVDCDVHSRYMWWTVIQTGVGQYRWHSGLFESKLHLLVFLTTCRNLIKAQNMVHIRPIYTIFLTISNHFPTHSFERYSNKNKTSCKTSQSSK